MLNIDTETANKALELRRRWEAHANDHCASSNTLFAIFGIASKCGRIADKFTFNNSPYGTWLADIAFERGMDDSREIVPTEGQQSAAAREMEEHGLTRSSGRRVSPTNRAQHALLNYYRERLDILSKINIFLAESKPRELKEYKSKIDKHKSAVVTVINEVSALSIRPRSNRVI